mmetsp:Transcript_10037/g.15278  ORF Transcript_10037/g.15278 Transcript_10037/m.15278 type:complete len:265 (+) Transcript_10037:3611-4405(+)
MNRAVTLHLLLEIFFTVNAFQLEQMSICKVNELSKSYENVNDISNSEEIQDCIRELKRVFKSIVQGPEEGGEPEEGPSNQVFDDIHVLSCMNQFLGCPSRQAILSYAKLNKLLRNYIIFATETMEELPNEVSAQNSDLFIDIINNCLKLIGEQQSKVVSFDQVSLLIDFIHQITAKSKHMGIDVDVPQFIHIFTQLFDLLDDKNQFELWMALMKQFIHTLTLNSNLVQPNNQQNAKHAHNLFKNQLVSKSADFFGGEARAATNI